MPNCVQVSHDGKDVIIFATRKDHSIKSSVNLPELEPSPGIILPNGEINWQCPCLGGLASGPCGIQFRNAFTCFHWSKADPKGGDCLNSFKSLQDCMVKHPKVYKNDTIPPLAGEEGDPPHSTHSLHSSHQCDSSKHVKM